MNVEEIRKKVRSLCEGAGLQFFFAVPNASEWAVTDCEHLRKIVSYHKELETLPLATPAQSQINDAEEVKAIPLEKINKAIEEMKALADPKNTILDFNEKMGLKTAMNILVRSIREGEK